MKNLGKLKELTLTHEVLRGGRAIRIARSETRII